MSGLEVVGVVLGSIPIIVTALEHYQSGVRTLTRVRRYKKEVSSIARQLREQQPPFVNSCEKLLDGVVCESDGRTMISNPESELWSNENIRQKVKVKLDRDMTVFLETAQAMRQAIDEVKQKLDLDSKGEVKLYGGRSIRLEFGRAMTPFKRSDYNELLEVVRTGNATLDRLVQDSVALKSRRQSRTQNRIMKIFHDISRSVYNALLSGISCSCSGYHRASIGLSKPALVCEDDDEQLIKHFNFRIAFSYDPKDPETDRNARYWDELVLRVAQQPRKELSLPTQASYPSTKSKAKKSVKFSATAGPQRSLDMMGRSGTTSGLALALPGTMASLNLGPGGALSADSKSSLFSRDASTTNSIADVVDLCHTITRAQKRPEVDCYGYVTDNTAGLRKFGVYPLDRCDDSQTWNLVTLREVLSDKGRKLPFLRHADQCWLAVVISSSILQLHNISWLPETLKSKDILFIRRDDATTYNQAYLAKRLPEEDTDRSTPSVSDRRSRHQNPTLLYLGILLIELILEDTWDNICLRNDQKGLEELTELERDYEVARSLLHQVVETGGENYGSAVRRCVMCQFNSQNASLDDDGFRQEVYSKVVALFEENLDPLQ